LTDGFSGFARFNVNIPAYIWIGGTSVGGRRTKAKPVFCLIVAQIQFGEEAPMLGPRIVIQ
jgi:hypothetical protein